MERTESNKNVLDGVLRYIISLGIVFLWTFFYQKILLKHLKGAQSNLVYYVSLFIVFIIAFLLCSLVPNKKLKSEKVCNKKIWICIFSFIAIAIFMIFFFNETKMFDATSYYMPWHHSRRGEMIFCGGVVIIALFVLMNMDRMVNIKINRGMMLIYILFALLAAYAVYMPNFLSAFYNTYHTHAYFNSVYRVIQGGAYSDVNLGVYGFYGIIMGPIVKLFGGTYFGFNIALAIFTFLSIMCFFYTIDNLVDSDLLKILCCFGISFGFIALQGGIYHQNFPHRHIFAGFLSGFMTFSYKHKKMKKYRWIICVLSIIWNFETGIACTLGYAGYQIVGCIKDNGIKWKKIIINILMLPVCIIGAYIIVNLYNIIFGHGLLDVKYFLFPFMSANSYMDTINKKIEMFPSLWMLVCALLLSIIAIAINRILINGQKRIDYRLCIVTGMEIIVIIQASYYINRPAYGNLAIVLPILVILMAYEIEQFWQNNKNGRSISDSCKNVVAVALTTGLIILAGISISRYYVLEEQRDQNRDKTKIYEMMSAIEQDVPNGTMGVGIGVPEIYSCMGRDTGEYLIDFSDFGALTVDKQKKAAEQVAGQDALFVEQESLDNLIQANPEAMGDFYDNYDGKLIYQVDNLQFCYYTKK